jgi:uncharacterized protein
MTATLLLSVLGASLMGSLHCAGMCGGLVGFAGGSLNRKRRATGQVAYHLGRLFAYLGLGALAGAVGLGLNSAAARSGVSGTAALLAGSVMVVWAIVKLLPERWLSRVRGHGSAKSFGCGFSRAFTRLQHFPPIARAAALGLATGLLPCGWLYAFVLTAAGTGSIAAGASILVAFWLGTLPALVGIGSIFQLLGERARKLLPALSACLLLLLGVGNVWSRHGTGQQVLQAPASALPELTPNTDPTAAPSDANLPPCHRR